jgi:hypothetical protein
MTTAFKIHASDNVATLLEDAPAGPIDLRGSTEAEGLVLIEPVALGHKAALAPIAEGEPVVKFGVPVGVAAQAISAGEWVHLHNCRSSFDARSGSFDVVTGTAKDTRYD